MKEVTPEEFFRSPGHGARYVILRDGGMLAFSPAGPHSGFVHNGELIGMTTDSTVAYLSPKQIRSVGYYDAKAAESLLLGIGGLGVVALLFLGASLGGGGWL
jgi:hypothetical protein